ncbi:MAG: hypothetical protein KDC13_09890 [Bacteroidetes bacterium]|nr:hypothetical protein [Bacteroidota bacterium]
MKPKLNILLAITLGMLIFQGCKKDKEEYGPVPEIEFVSISPSTVKAFSDSVVIKIKYTDGDADLGENTSGVENAFITDSRSSLTYGLRIRQLAPDGANIIIQGEVDLVIPAVGHAGGSGNEQASFQVYVKDRAGNQSNVVTTSAISILP